MKKEFNEKGCIGKKSYTRPMVVNFTDNLVNTVPGALYGAALMVARSLAKVMKGGIDLTAGADTPVTIQRRK